jgi:hypothetical protein
VVLCGLLISLTVGAKAGADDGTATEKPGAATQQDKHAPTNCAAFGPRFFAVGENGLCATVGAVVQVHSAKEFTNHDLYMIGQRVPTIFNKGAGVPMVYYYLDDISKQTKYPTIGTVSSAFLMLTGQNDLGLFRGFVRAKIDANTRYDHNGDASFELHKIDDSYYLGALDEAWVQWNGLKVGVQPSMFGFNRLPSVVTPGYTSIITTLAASYTHGVSHNMSVSIAAEDPDRRLMGEGILARPSRPDMPDIVGMVRYATPASLFHLSGALHQAEDHVMRDFTGGSTASVRGWAWSAGLQSRVRWDQFVGAWGEGMFGRLGLTAAYTQGAIGYLGVPFFATDYVVGGDGTFHRSKGWSGLISYEHMLARNVKLSLNASYFSVSMQSSPETVIPELNPDMPALPGLSFDVDVRGSVLQAGVEFMPMQNLTVGVEGGYTITEAEGRYVGVQGDKERAGFPHVGVYVRRAF